jgi:hypothetical protein
MATTTGQRRSRPNSGDLTGRQRAKASREQQLEQQDRVAETTMATAAQSEEERHGVFDPRSGERIDQRSVAFVEDDDEDDAIDEFDPPDRFSTDGDEEREPVLTGKEDEAALAPILQARKERRRPRAPRVHSAVVRIRVDQDIEKMTYGINPVSQEPNNYDLREGLMYELPYEVAEHLDERGLIREWVRG